MKYIAFHKDGVAQVIAVCVAQKVPFILNDDNEIELVEPNRQGINALIMSGIKVIKAKFDVDCKLEYPPMM